jgi:hypothetical protein
MIQPVCAMAWQAETTPKISAVLLISGPHRCPTFERSWFQSRTDTRHETGGDHMNRLLQSLAFLGLLSTSAATAHALTPAHFWSQRFGNSSPDATTSMAVDPLGNVFVTGYFYNTVDLGGGALESAGAEDIFIAKYDANGAHLWSQRLGGAGGDYPSALTVSDFGLVLIAGTFEATTNLGGGDLVSVGSYDIFVASYDASTGGHNWSKRFGGTGGDEARGLAVDASGNVLVTGNFNGTASFGGGALVSAGGYDVVLAKYNVIGAHQWSQRFGGVNDDQGWSAACDISGSVLMVGTFGDTVDFGGGGLTSAGFDDIFMAKYTDAGVHQWSQSFGGLSFDRARSVVVDASGSAFVTGSFIGTVDFGGGDLVTDGSQDMFVAKYAANGGHLWSRRIGGAGGDQGASVSVDALGNVFLAAYYDDTMTIGNDVLMNAGSRDICVAKYDANGTYQMSRGCGSADFDEGSSAAADGLGNVFVTGSFSSTVDFGGGGLVSAGSTDIFLAKYAGTSAEPWITSIDDLGNDQGYQVTILFNRSGHDHVDSPTPVTQYEVFRRIDAPPASAKTGRSPSGLSQRELLLDGWLFVGFAPAHGESTYGLVAPTIGDSTAALGPYYSAYFVRAATATPATFFDSPPDSGYSIDNLAPSVPMNLANEDGLLTWEESTAQDFDYFTVYGGSSNDFAAATVVDYTVAPAMDVTSAGYVFYFVTATDFSGNEGMPAVINTLSDVGGMPKRYLLSLSNYPNPFNPRTTVRYTVPAPGPVTIAVYDARGTQVATLVRNERRDAGAYQIDWNGRSDSGAAMSSGVYFARIEQSGVARSRKMVLLK